MSKVAEYASVDALVRPEVVDTRTVSVGRKPRTYELVRCGPGWEPAGSMARWTDGYHAVRFYAGGSTHGLRFVLTPKGESDARALLEKWAPND